LPLARADLEQRWLELTRTALPVAAEQRGWTLRHDHCFQRVLLDAACDGCWYDHVQERPAYRHAPEAMLVRAVELGDQLLEGSVELEDLNAKSLKWRAERQRTGVMAPHRSQKRAPEQPPPLPF
jgi:hypothetical protein